MSRLNTVVLPRGIGDDGSLWCSLVWSPLPPAKTSDQPDPATLADWPETIKRLALRVRIGDQLFDGELDQASAQSAVWKAVVAGAAPTKAVLPAPGLAAGDLITFGTRTVHQLAQQLESAVQKLGLLRTDVPLVQAAVGAVAPPVSRSLKTTSASSSINAYAEAALADVHDWHRALSPLAEPPLNRPVPTPPSLAELLSAALTFPPLALRLGLVVAVRLHRDRVRAGKLSGPQWMTAQANDPVAKLSFNPPDAVACFIGSSFTLLDGAAGFGTGPGAGPLDHFDARPGRDFDVLDYDPVVSFEQRAHDEQLLQPEVSRGFEFHRVGLKDALSKRRLRFDARSAAPTTPTTNPATEPPAIPSASPTTGAEAVLDYLTGVRVDVHSSSATQGLVPAGSPGTWRSLMWRHSEVAPNAAAGPAAAFAPFTTDDEGSLALTQIRTQIAEKEVQAVDERVGSWTGWSLAAPRVGRGQAVSAGAGPELDDPGAPPDTFGVQVVVRPPNGQTAPERALTPLRFGRDYRFRLRPADLAGWSPPPPTAETWCSTVQRFTRRDRLGPPVVVFGSVPSEGESAEELVIRSVAQDPQPGEPAGPEELAFWLTRQLRYPYTATSVRHLLPPSVSVVTAEQHGSFDRLVVDENGAPRPGGARRSLRVAAKVDGTFGHTGFADTEVDVGVDPAGTSPDAATPLPGLGLVPRWPAVCPKDVAAQLAALPVDSDHLLYAQTLVELLTTGLATQWPQQPGAPLPKDLAAAYLGTDPVRCPHLPDPAAQTLNVRLLRRGAEVAAEQVQVYDDHTWPEPRGWKLVLIDGSDLTLAAEPDARTLTVTLPAGMRAELEVSAAPAETQLPLLHAYTNPDVDQTPAAQSILTGRHPQVSAVLKLGLRHAVMRPNVTPGSPPKLSVQAARTLGGPDLRLFGTVVVDRDSTGGLDISGAWSTIRPDGPKTEVPHTRSLSRLAVDDTDTLTLSLSQEPPVPPLLRAPEDSLAVVDLPDIGIEKVTVPGFSDPGDPAQVSDPAVVADLWAAQASRFDKMVELMLEPAQQQDALGALRSRAQAGHISALISSGDGINRVIDVVPLLNGSRASRFASGLNVPMVPSVAGLSSPEVPAATGSTGESPLSHVRLGRSDRAQPAAKDVGPGQRTPVGQRGDDGTSRLAELDLDAARVQFDVEQALASETIPFTVADTLVPRAGAQALLRTQQGTTTTATVLGPAKVANSESAAAFHQILVGGARVVVTLGIVDFWHHVGDTRHLAMTYAATALTRYRDCFPADDVVAWSSWKSERRAGPGRVPVPAPEPLARLGSTTVAASWLRRGQPLTIPVPATVAPPVPKVTRLISAQHGKGEIAPGVRVYLGDTWFASGDEEKLGVLLLDKEPPKSVSAITPDASWDDVRPLSDVLSVVGADRGVAELVKDPKALPAPQGARFLLKQDLLVEDEVGAGMVGAPQRRTYEPEAYWLRESDDDDEPRRVSVAAHPVRWSDSRRQYYADVYFEQHMAGAFVRMALVRFQPWGLVREPRAATKTTGPYPGIDLRCSATLLSEFAWLNGSLQLKA